MLRYNHGLLLTWCFHNGKRRCLPNLWEGRLAPITHRGIATTIATAYSVIAPGAGLPQKHTTAASELPLWEGRPRPDYPLGHTGDITTVNSVSAAIQALACHPTLTDARSSRYTDRSPNS